MVDLQYHPKPLQSHPKCMNRISKSRTLRGVPYFKMITGFCITRDWTHFLPLKLMCTEHCLWKNLTAVHVCLLFLWAMRPAHGVIPLFKNSIELPSYYFFSLWFSQLFRRGNECLLFTLLFYLFVRLSDSQLDSQSRGATQMKWTQSWINRQVQRAETMFFAEDCWANHNIYNNNRQS